MIHSLLSAVTLLGAVAAQDLPPGVSTGTVFVQYSYDFGAYAVIGVDIASGAALQIIGVDQSVQLRTPEGECFTAHLGESALTPASSDRVVTAEQLTDTMPFLVANTLREIDPDRLRVERGEDGGWTVTARLVIGNLGLTHRGYNPPTGPNDRIVTYHFDGMGTLVATEFEGSDPIPIITIDGDHPRLAPVLKRAEGGSAEPLSTAEIYPEGRPDLFSPEAAVERSMRIALEQAEASQRSIRERLATPAGQEQLRESNRQTLGEDAPSSLRWPIILTGVALIALAIVAVLRRRS